LAVTRQSARAAGAYLPNSIQSQDARFLGSPVDLVVFDGLAAGAVRRVVFLEVKTAARRSRARTPVGP